MVLLGRICLNIEKFYLPLVIILFILMTCKFNQAVLQSFKFRDEDDYEYEIFFLLLVVLLHEPTSFWWEQVIKF